MAYGLTTAFHKINKLNKRIRVVQGGTSAGKTIAILIILIDYASRHQNKLITIASSTYPHLRRGTLRDIKNILTENNMWAEFGIVHNKTENTFTFATGTVIEFIALDEGQARGARRDVLFLNEANLVSNELFAQLEVRTKEIIFIDYNPTSEFWAHTELVAKRDDVDFIKITYTDNEALSDEIVQAIERRKNNKNWWRVYGLGEIGELEGLVYYGWEMITDIPKEAELKGYGLDFGYTNDPTAIVAVYYLNGTYILDEVCYRTGMFNSDIASVIEAQGLAKVMGVGDSSEPKSIDEIAKLGMMIKGATKTSGDKTKTYNQWAVSKIQEMKISYTSRSINLQKEYLSYMWQTDRTGKNLNVPQDGNDHLLDAAKYKLLDLNAPKLDWADWSVR